MAATMGPALPNNLPAPSVPSALAADASNTLPISMTTMSNTSYLPLKLSQLQNYCKRDPEGYKEEYDAQRRRLVSMIDIWMLSGDSAGGAGAIGSAGGGRTSSKSSSGGGGGKNSAGSGDSDSNLVELIQFMAAVSSSSYKGVESDRVAGLLMGLLMGNLDYSIAVNSNGGGGSTASPAFLSTLPTAAQNLPPRIRRTCVSALILMRNKGAIPPLQLIQLFFQLMSVVPDKGLREMLYCHIVNDVRNINKPRVGKKSKKGGGHRGGQVNGANTGKKDEQLNRTIMTFFHRLISASLQECNTNPTSMNSTSGNSNDDPPTLYAAKRATQITCELYRRTVWSSSPQLSSRSIHILETAAAHPHPVVMSRALRFFLNIEETMAEDEQYSKDKEWEGAKEKVDLHLFSKKTKARKRSVDKSLKERVKKQNERENKIVNERGREDKGVESSKKLFPAIELLNDPQGLVETLLKRIKRTGANSSGDGGIYKFEIKMLMLNFVTRVVGNHSLLLLPLYPLLQRYMSGHQRDVTSILAYAVQSCHEYVPPEEVYGILKTILHNFVTERCSGEQMAVGINAVRCICARIPSVLSMDNEDNDDGDEGEEAGENGSKSKRKKKKSTTISSSSWDTQAFVRDLACYAKHRDRSVSIAGRSWVNFIREVYPSLLQGKDRGLVGAGLHKAGERPLRYGEVRALSGVEGSELLVAYEEAKQKRREGKKASASSEEGNDEDHDEEEEEYEEEMEGLEEEEDSESGWIEMKDGSDVEVEQSGDEDEDGEENEGEESENEAPDLILFEDNDEKPAAESSSRPSIEVNPSKLTPQDRSKLQQQVSSTRIFSAAEFTKMQQLVERQQRAKRDPRLAARLKRAALKGEEFADLLDDNNGGNGGNHSDGSDADSAGNSDYDVSDDDEIHIKGAVNPSDIMADAKRKRMSKAEKLEKIIEGRQKWESKERGGGSTNTEKKRKKNFAMSKFSFATRKKMGEKGTAKQGRKRVKANSGGRDAKKRRRKF